ncbi:MAG: YwmB family TATA-box binding protein [Lachnospiraceae bacterium]|nr:YwmB family TATA-box binding protein [Lachnospiraceae bacterium]
MQNEHKQKGAWIVTILMFCFGVFVRTAGIELGVIECNSTCYQIYQGYGNYIGDGQSFEAFSNILVETLEKEKKDTKWVLEKRDNAYVKVLSVEDISGNIKGTVSLYLKDKPYIKIDFMGIDELENFEKTFIKIERLLNKNFAEKFTGYFYKRYNFNGKLSKAEQIGIVNQYLKEQDANKVMDMQIENMINVYAYAPDRNNSVSMNGKMINLNLAFSYNEQENETEFYVASPFLNIDF